MCRAVIGDVRLDRLEPVTGFVHLQTTFLGELDLIEVNLERTAALRVGDLDLRLFVLNLELIIVMFTLGVVEINICRLGLACHCFLFYAR